MLFFTFRGSNVYFPNIGSCNMFFLISASETARIFLPFLCCLYLLQNSLTWRDSSESFWAIFSFFALFTHLNVSAMKVRVPFSCTFFSFTVVFTIHVFREGYCINRYSYQKCLKNCLE